MAAKLKPLSEQVMVLTGASSAVGLCTAQMAALLGARLVLVAHSTRVLESLVGVIHASGTQVLCMAADVAVRQQLAAVAAATVQHFGRIDTWINNASVSMYGRLDQASEADSRRLFDVNFWGVVNGSMVALPHLSAVGGCLVNVGSELADATPPLQGMYSSSKQAVKGFTDALRQEAEAVDRGPVSVTLVEPAGTGSSPAIDPMRVAEAILKAAAEGGRDVAVPVATASLKAAPCGHDEKPPPPGEQRQATSPV